MSPYMKYLPRSPSLTKRIAASGNEIGVQRFQTCLFESLEIVHILCFLIASQDILRLLQIIMALSAFSNRSLLKCAATLSGRDTQSEMETETSCDRSTSINTGMFTTQTKTVLHVLLRLFDTQDLAEKSR